VGQVTNVKSGKGERKNMETIKEGKRTLNHDAIAKAARDLWQKEGCQSGRDVEYWLKAEQQLMAENNQPKSAAPNTSTKPKSSPAGAKNSNHRKAVL
jgi:hypothetical protein